MRSTVAVVGAGVSGLTAAHVLRRSHDVVLLESEDRLGGHAHTHTVTTDGGADRVDSGFIVHNDRTYPLLRRLFAELDVPVRPTEMSMSITCEDCGLSYAGGRKLDGLFAQRRRLGDPRYLRLLASVKRFQRLANTLLDQPADAAEPQTYGDFLRAHGFGEHFVHHYAIPVVACVWSSGRGTALEYPARYLFTFLRHHGFLSVSGSPQWYTVEGGSRTYVDKLAAGLDDVRVSTPVRAVSRKPDGIELLDAAGTVHRADKVVVATHADDALALLTDATDDERAVLGSFDYSDNHTVLHRDESLLPSARGARASWNYRMNGCAQGDGSPTVTYWMNKLQGLDESTPYLVSLNSDGVDPATVIAEMDYRHPIYTPTSVAAQERLAGLNDGRTAFAGAYHGWGFHEDGCRSGVAAAESLGGTWT
ncbi:MAG: FAD-dependent oxidoreductase [Aeromicrobium erythreum]